MGARQGLLDLGIGHDAMLVKIDEQHLARLQTPLGDDFLLWHRQHAHLGGEHDQVVVGDEIPGRTKSVAVEGRADLATVGEGDRRRSVPRLHKSGMVFVKGTPLLVHQRIAGPSLWDEHHHRVDQRVAALNQEFERVVEAGGVGLAFVRNRPEL